MSVTDRSVSWASPAVVSLGLFLDNDPFLLGLAEPDNPEEEIEKTSSCVLLLPQFFSFIRQVHNVFVLCSVAAVSSRDLKESIPAVQSRDSLPLIAESPRPPSSLPLNLRLDSSLRWWLVESRGVT